jgi:hypothetical protein
MPAAGTSSCSVVLSDAAAVDSAVRSAPAGSAICLAAGTYPGLDLSGTHTGDVTVEPSSGQSVTVTAGVTGADGGISAVHVEPGASHVIVHGLYITGGVELEAGDSFIRIDHNDITGHDFGVRLNSSNCKTPNAPAWNGCQPLAKITDVTISGNRIHNVTTDGDAININNYARVRVTGNEFVGVVDPGGRHVDCLQSTFGGSGLVFDHNYEHDNNCQGLFIKDGDVTDATVYDNLFVRDQINGVSEQNVDIVDVYGLLIRNNTSWPGTGDILRDLGSAGEARAVVDHNVLESFANGCCGDSAHFRLTERENRFSQAPSTFAGARTDRGSNVAFVDPSSDDYRLAVNPKGIGIDWRPADQHFGP